MLLKLQRAVLFFLLLAISVDSDRQGTTSDNSVSDNTTDTVTSSAIKPKVPWPHYWQTDVYLSVSTYCPPFIILMGTVNNILAVLVLQSRGLRASGTNFLLTALAVTDIGVLYSGFLRFWLLAVTKGQVSVFYFITCVC